MYDSSAKRIIFSIAVAILLLSILSWFPSPEPKDIGRFCINGMLCWFLFKGKNWARWTLVAFLVLGGAIGVFAITYDRGETEKSIVLLVMSITYIASASLLVFSKTVAQYFSTPIEIDS